MRYLKLYEDFTQVEIEEPQLIDKPIDDTFLGGDTTSHIDSSGVIHIKNWNVY